MFCCQHECTLVSCAPLSAHPELLNMKKKSNSRKLPFKGKVLMVGCGSIGQAILPLIFKHLAISPRQVSIIAADKRGFEAARKYGVRHEVRALTRENYKKEIQKRGWDGRIVNVDGDYLLWVDANLAALKTDHALKRSLYYEFSKQSDGRFLALAQMTYNHQGKFDWRTTRYRTYARVFVPAGSELVLVEQVNAMGQNTKIIKFDQGGEAGKKWFGAFVSIEPGETLQLNFHYLLPEYVSRQIQDGTYTLFVQKQLGTIAHGLTLDLDFGKNIVSAKPVELESDWGDEVYRHEGDLRVDRKFEIGF